MSLDMDEDLSFIVEKVVAEYKQRRADRAFVLNWLRELQSLNPDKLVKVYLDEFGNAAIEYVLKEIKR